MRLAFFKRGQAMAKTTTSNLKLTATDRVSKKLQNISKKFTKLNKDVKKTSKSFAAFKKTTLIAGRSIRKFGKQTRAIGSGMTRNMTLPILGVGVGILTMAARFEKSMNKVQAKSGATEDQFKALRDQAKLLGSTTQFSASQAADGMSFLAQAGWKASQILKGMPALLNLAASSETELARAADIASNIMGAFNIKAEETGRVADVLAAATAGANVDMEQLALAMEESGPIAKDYGVSLEGAAAAAGILGNAGIQGSKAGTAMKRAFLALAAPGGEAAKMLNIMGVKTADSKGNMLEFSDVMKNLGGKLASFPQQARLKVLEGVFGKIGIAGASMLAKSAKSGELEAFGKRLQNVNGVAKQMAETMNKGASGGMVKLMSAAEGLAIAIGDSGLLGWFTKAVSKLTEWVAKLSDTDKATLKWITIIAGALAVLGPIITGVGALITAFGFLAPIITTIGSIFGVILPIIGTLAAVIGGPALLAIGALVAAGIAIYKYWEPIKELFSEIGKGISSAFKGLQKVPYLGRLLGGDGQQAGNDQGNRQSGIIRSIGAPARKIVTTPKDGKQNVVVDFKNMPKGVQVDQSGSKSKGLELNLGYQGAAAI